MWLLLSPYFRNTKSTGLPTKGGWRTSGTLVLNS